MIKPIERYTFIDDWGDELNVDRYEFLIGQDELSEHANYCKASDVRKLEQQLNEAVEIIKACVTAFDTTDANEEILPYEIDARRKASDFLSSIGCER